MEVGMRGCSIGRSEPVSLIVQVVFELSVLPGVMTLDPFMNDCHGDRGKDVSCNSQQIVIGF